MMNYPEEDGSFPHTAETALLAEDGTKYSTNEILSSDIVENGTYRIEQDEES
jgi:hypothetical protein